MRNVAAAMVFCMTLSCSDINAVKNTVNEQNDRLSSLEDALESVNGNTLAISALIEGKILITGFEERTDGAGTVVGYRLDLSDGQTVEVTFGDRLDALVPVVGVDEEGTFIYSMDGGKTFSPVEGADKAFAEDGTSPEVGLDGDGYWTVSVDGGQSWTRMLDANGLPVNAFSVNSSGGNTFFSDVNRGGTRCPCGFRNYLLGLPLYCRGGNMPRGGDEIPGPVFGGQGGLLLRT